MRTRWPDLRTLPFEHRRHVEPARDRRDVDVLVALERERRGARGNAQPGDLREHVQQLLGQAVGKVLVRRVVAQVDERQHRDRRRRCVEGRGRSRSRVGCVAHGRGLIRGERHRRRQLDGRQFAQPIDAAITARDLDQAGLLGRGNLQAGRQPFGQPVRRASLVAFDLAQCRDRAVRAFRQCGMRQPERHAAPTQPQTERHRARHVRPRERSRPLLVGRGLQCVTFGAKNATCDPPPLPTVRPRSDLPKQRVQPRGVAMQSTRFHLQAWFVRRRPSAARPSGPGRALGLGHLRVRRHHDGDRRRPSGRVDDDRHGSGRADFRPRIQHRRLCLFRACGMRARLFQDGPRERGPNDRASARSRSSSMPSGSCARRSAGAGYGR